MEVENIQVPSKKKYKLYDEEDLKFALREVREGKISMNQAFKKYNVPVKTISWRLQHEQIQKEEDKRGATKVLTEEEEKKIANWLIESAKLGCPKTVDDLKSIAHRIRELRKDNGPVFKNGLPSTFWVNDFLTRNPNVSFRKAETLSRCAANVNESQIRNFFSNFYSFLEERNYLDVLQRPDAFYNLDESGFQLGDSIDRVLAQKGSKNVYKVDGMNSKLMITTTFGFGASGDILPTQIIYKKSFSKSFEAAVEIGRLGAKFVLSETDSGWQTKKSFKGYIENIVEYLEAKNIQKPIFIFFDNHASHLNYELFEWCSERDVHIVTFPPYTTHILQMCDVSIFGAAKSGWKKEVHAYKERTGNHLNELSFLEVLKQVVDKVITKEKIINGFRATGLMPFDVNNVDLSKCIGDDSGKAIENSTVQMEVNHYEQLNVEQYHEQLEIERLDMRTHNEDEIVQEQFEYDMDEYEYQLNLNQVDEDEYDVGSNEFSNSPTMKVHEYPSYNSIEELTELERKKQIEAVLANMQKDAAKLKELLKAEKEDDLTINNINFMEQQLQAIDRKYNQKTCPNPTVEVTDSGASIDTLLKLPNKFRRKAVRTYKEKNYGVMTHEKVMETHMEVVRGLQEAEQIKVQKKKEKELQKEIRQKILQMKKENSENNQKAKRGRPKKNKD